MFYKIAKYLDNFFEEIKYMITLIVFFNIAMAVLFFIYWLVFSARLTMPYWLELFIWNVIDFFAQSIKGTPLYKEIIPVLPVLVSGVFVVVTYFLNCFVVFLENNHERLNKKVEDYKHKIAKKINEELHHDFINELKKNSHMLLKIKIVATMHSSYLTAMTDAQIDTAMLQDKIQKGILASMNEPYIQDKSLSNGSLSFLLNDISKSKDFIINLVTNSSRLIKPEIVPKLEIAFYCAVELLDNLADLPARSAYLDRVLNIKIKNKIIATPKFKLYFETIYPSVYHFDVLGQYNIESEEGGKLTSVMVYALRRKY